MALRKAKPVKWMPAGLSDALDGSDEFPGALALAQNLIPAQNNQGMFVARPAATKIATLPDYGGGSVTCLAAVGNMLYGMYASAQFSGKDRPFAYNLVTGAFSAIAGLASSNLPTSQATTGDWTPPTAENVAKRILFTHPGFPDGPSQPIAFLSLEGNTHGTTTLDNIQPSLVLLNQSGQIPIVGQAIYGPNIATNTTISAINAAGTSITLSKPATGSASLSQFFVTPVNSPDKFGWLDVSNATFTIAANTYNGAPAIIGGFSVVGIQPGMAVAGTNIPANTVVEQAMALALGGVNNLVGISVTSGMTSASILVVDNQMIGSGMQIAGVGIAGGTVISGVTLSGTDGTHLIFNATLSIAALQTLSDAPVTLTGAEIVLSQPATGTADGVGVTITGGTPSAPLWSSGDTQINPLPGIPVFVRQIAGSAAFGVNTTNPATAGVVFSDPSLPCQVTNASQAITFSNAVPVTAAAGLPLENQLGGIIQSLVVFQGASNIQQITGSVALGNITVNTSQVATGTFAANSVASTPKGVIFAAPFGLRIIDFEGRITDPIGVKGTGMVLPFQNAVNPTRIAAAFNENVYRVTITWQPPPLIQVVWGSANRTDEFWLHLDTMKFSGPHTSLVDLAAPWISNETFVCALSGGRGALWQSDPDQGVASTYVENTTPLTWKLQTVLLPDDPGMMANSLVETSVFASMDAATQWLASFIGDQGDTLDQAYMWLGPAVTQAQLPIYWRNEIVFRQGALQITGNSEPQTTVGTINLRYQQLGYQLPAHPKYQFIVGQDVLGVGGALPSGLGGGLLGGLLGGGGVSTLTSVTIGGYEFLVDSGGDLVIQAPDGSQTILVRKT